MYAIIKTGGKQYKVSEGDILDIDKLSKEAKEVIEFIQTNKLSQGHAKVLVGLENAVFVANKIIDKKLSVKDVLNKFDKIFKEITI